MSIGWTIASRLLQTLPVLWCAATLVFCFMLVIPGDPARAIAGPRAPDEAVRLVAADLGLDRPPLERYLAYMGRVAMGDLGKSYVKRQPVARILGEALVRTLFLGGAALFLALVLGIPAGVAAARRGGAVDALLTAGTTLGISIPTFWIGLLFMLAFASHLGWLPVSGYGEGLNLMGIRAPAWRHLILPAATLAVFPWALVARVTRASMLEQMRAGHILAARARGIRPSALVWRHSFRNALGPILTVGGLLMGTLLGGAIATEIVYTWPGLGQVMYRALGDRDLMVVEGGVILLTAIFVAVNLAVDLTYSLIDPRIRRGRP